MGRELDPDELMCRSVGENIDALVTLDLRGHGVPRVLFGAAQELAGGPVIMHAARLIADRVPANAPIAICTGFVFPPYFTGELDGAVGAAVVARAVELALGARPVLLLEPELVEAAAALLRTAGLQPTGNVEYWRQRPHQALVLGFTKEETLAPAEAERILDQLQPAAVLSIERPGRNALGTYHMGNGVPVTELAAKLDHLFEQASQRGLLTVAIGDLGNELGMGRLQGAVRAGIPFGARCNCPCGGGIAAAVGAEATIVAAVSDWAAYGLAAALRYLSGQAEALHSGELERRLLRAAVSAGLIDGSGYAIPAVDGIGEDHNARLVEMLRTAVEQPLRTKERYRPAFERVLELRGRQR